MGRKLSTVMSTTSRDYCEVHFDYKEEYAYLRYFTEQGVKYFEESFHGKTLRYVEEAAENWSIGIKKLQCQ